MFDALGYIEKAGALLALNWHSGRSERPYTVLCHRDFRNIVPLIIKPGRSVYPSNFYIAFIQSIKRKSV